MIELLNGQARSYLTPEEELAQIQTELATFTPAELAALKAVMGSLDPGGTSAFHIPVGSPTDLLQQFSAAEYVRTPVSIEQFVKDPYYLGNTCDVLYPRWVQDLTELFAGNYHEAVFTGAIGCLRGDTLIHDPVAGDAIPVAERHARGSTFQVWSLGPEGPVPAMAMPPIRYAPAPMLRVTFATGESVTVTPQHRFWTGRAWVTAAEVAAQLRQSEPVLLASSSDIDPPVREQGAPRWTRTVPDSRAGCPQGPHSGGGPPPPGSEVGRVPPPSRGGVPGRSRGSQLVGALASTAERIRACRASGLPSTPRSSPAVARAVAEFRRVLESLTRPGSGWFPGAMPLLAGIGLPRTDAGLRGDDPPSIVFPGYRDDLATTHSPSQAACGEAYHGSNRHTTPPGFVRVVSVEELPAEPYYDFHVPVFQNYRAAGVWHHNTGKSFAASIVICRILYEISCMRDPHRSFGLAPGTNISLVCMSVNQVLATKVAFEYIATKIEASPYFTEHFPFEKTKVELRFPRSVWVAARASTDTSALGLNTIAAFMDEGNFLPDVSAKNKARFGLVGRAETIYYTLKRRLKSRFARQGRLPGKLVIVSSKKTTEDFTDKLIRDAIKAHDSHTFVRDYSQWDTRPEEYFSTETFPVLCGNDSTPSKILTVAEEAEIQKALPEGTIIVQVPESFRDDFTKDLEAAIRDLAGRSTVAMAPFITQREAITRAVAPPTFVHPFSTPVWHPEKGGKVQWDLLTAPQTEVTADRRRVQVQRPRLNPRRPRHGHMDPSLTGDSAGMAIAHVAGFREVVRRNLHTNSRSLELAPVIVVDFLLQVVPPPGGEILMGDLRELFYEFSGHGYALSKLTSDSYQARDSLQQFRAKGYEAEVVSVDRNPEAYNTLKLALYEDRILYYEYQPLLTELRTLERNPSTGKIDHPALGSKDTADALAGVVSTLVAAFPTYVEGYPILRGGDLVSSFLDAGAVKAPAPNRAFVPLIVGGGFRDEGDDDSWDTP